VAITLTPNPYPIEFNGVQNADAYLGTFSVPAGTYNSITVTFSASELTFMNGGGTTSDPKGSQCPAETLCGFAYPAGSAQIQSSPLPITLASGQQVGLALRFNGSTAITETNSVLNINYSTQNALSLVSLPRPGTATGLLDTVENFTGQVTALSSSSITVQNGFGVLVTASIGSNVTVNDPQMLCPGGSANTSCLAENQTVSINAGVDSTGKVSLLEADLLDAGPIDEAEGIMMGTPSLGPLYLILTNKVVASGNASLTNAQVGDVMLLTLANAPVFLVDGGELSSVLPASVKTQFQAPSDISYTQDLMVHPTTVSGSSASGNLQATVDQVRLRFGNFSGPVSGILSPQAFLLNPYTPGTFESEIGHVPEIQFFQGTTAVDGISATSSVAVNDPVSTRCLFVATASSCYAAKVRDTISEQ
jgi:hypothetical protein